MIPEVIKPSSKEELAADFIPTISDVSGLPIERITNESRLEDIGIDSLDRMELLVHAENRYGALVTDSAAFKMKTVGDLIDETWKALKGESNE